MNTTEQQIAIAEACGWTQIYNLQHDLKSMHASKGWRGFPPISKGHRQPLPDYLTDLNAMHEAEKFLDESQDHPITYWEELEKVVGCKDSNDGNEMRKVICATAAQRSEAFLRTLGLWRDISSANAAFTDPDKTL
jgi:hypothetical protein